MAGAIQVCIDSAPSSVQTVRPNVAAPAANQKFADLAIVWLMLAAELEDQVVGARAKSIGLRFEKGA